MNCIMYLLYLRRLYLVYIYLNSAHRTFFLIPRCNDITVVDGVPQHGGGDDASDVGCRAAAWDLLQLHHVHGGFLCRLHHPYS